MVHADRDELERWAQRGKVEGLVVTPFRRCQPSFSHFKVT